MSAKLANRNNISRQLEETQVYMMTLHGTLYLCCHLALFPGESQRSINLKQRIIVTRSATRSRGP